MKKIPALLLSFLFYVSLGAQRSSPRDGDWSKQFLVLRNTGDADLMIRVGDIDNLGFGWENGFDPFTGKSTPSHGFPWDIDPKDARGTDRIMVPTSYVYGSTKANEGYTSSTSRPGNKPIPITIPLKELKNIQVDSAALQLFIDDFQSPTFDSKFQVKLNGARFTEAERMINTIKQDGPIGKLINIRLSPEFLSRLKGDSLVIYIDDPVTGIGDGFAIDFVKLLINPKLVYKGRLQGRIIDVNTREPIPHATASVEDYGSVVSDGEGNFTLENIPAGLIIVKGSAAGYSSDEKQVDVIADETSDPVELELKPSTKVNFNNQSMQEGDNLVMNNIQFNLNSAELLSAGKTDLDKLVELMKQNMSLEILLSGFTSAEGSPSLNKDLSLRRVRSCKDYLVTKGIDDGRITIKGYGPDLPIAPNDTEANRAKNRRVEMKITKL